MSLFAIGDIHGEITKLSNLIEKINPSDTDTIIFIGDYIDRGENSKLVIEFLIKLSESFQCIFLKGNHEWMLNRAFLSRKDLDLWLNNGGVETILNYGSMSNILPIHNDFFNSLKLYHETDDYIFVHAGLEPGIPIHLQHEETLLWIRDPFLNAPTGLDKIVIHGHSPILEPICFDGDKINIDTGAVYGGYLTAIQLPENIVFQV